MPTSRSLNGFTLIEMMVVMAIIGIMAALIAPRIIDKIQQSRITATKSQLNLLKTSINMFELDIGRVPSQAEGLQVLLSPPGNRRRYLDANELPVDAWKNPIVYRAPGEEQSTFTVSSFGADGLQGGEDDNQDLIVYAY